MGSFDEKEEKKDEGCAGFVQLEQVVEESPEPEEVQEPEPKVKEEPPREVFDVDVVGELKYKVIKKQDDFARDYYIMFTYEAVASFMEEDIKCTGEFFSSYTDSLSEDIYRGHYKHYYCSEERTYEWLVELLGERNDFIMDKLKSSIAGDIKNNLRNKKLKELKKLAGNGKIEINMNFKMEKPKV